MILKKKKVDFIDPNFLINPLIFLIQVSVLVSIYFLRKIRRQRNRENKQKKRNCLQLKLFWGRTAFLMQKGHKWMEKKLVSEWERERLIEKLFHHRCFLFAACSFDKEEISTLSEKDSLWSSCVYVISECVCMYAWVFQRV